MYVIDVSTKHVFAVERSKLYRRPAPGACDGGLGGCMHLYEHTRVFAVYPVSR